MNRTTRHRSISFRVLNRSVCALAMIAVSSTGAWAQHPSEKAAADYFEAIKVSGLGATADFMHPEAASQFKELLLPVVENSKTEQQLDELAGLFSSRDREEIASRPPQEFVRSIMAFANRQLGDSVQFERAEILGAIHENDVSHVLMRIHMTIMTGAMAKLDVASFKLDGSEWKMLLNAETEGMANAIRAQFPPQ